MVKKNSMHYQTNYSQGELLKKYSPMKVVVNFNFAQKYSMRISPFTSHGCTLSLFDEKNDELFKGEYTYISSAPSEFHIKMASDVAENMNILFDMENVPERVAAKEFEKIMLEALGHCELMDQRELVVHGYAVEIVFE